MPYITDAQSVIAADLDGTLSASKSVITAEMSKTLTDWLSSNRFAVISGGKYEQLVKQVVAALPADAQLQNLYLFPTNGSAHYSFADGEWNKVYELTLEEEEKSSITAALHEAVQKSGLQFPELYGEQIEYRGSQVSFSGLGQDAPLAKKILWDPDQSKRLYITRYLEPLLPDFKIGIGGTTTIDITRKGIDKEYAINRMKELLEVDNDHVIFFGDALFEGGNDWPATKTGVTCVKVADAADTVEKIKALHT